MYYYFIIAIIIVTSFIIIGLQREIKVNPCFCFRITFVSTSCIANEDSLQTCLLSEHMIQKSLTHHTHTHTHTGLRMGSLLMIEGQRSGTMQWDNIKQNYFYLTFSEKHSAPHFILNYLIPQILCFFCKVYNYFNIYCTMNIYLIFYMLVHKYLVCNFQILYCCCILFLSVLLLISPLKHVVTWHVDLDEVNCKCISVRVIYRKISMAKVFHSSHVQHINVHINIHNTIRFLISVQ